MQLKELIENYDNFILTEEYLTEGLKIFKESKKLYTISNKITNKINKIPSTNKEGISIAKKLADDIKKLADEYKKVEDDFANKKLDKISAVSALKKLKKDNETLGSFIKKENTKNILVKVGLGVLISGLGVLLGSILMNPGLISSIGIGIKSFSDAAKQKIDNFFGTSDKKTPTGVSFTGDDSLANEINTLKKNSHKDKNMDRIYKEMPSKREPISAPSFPRK